MKIKNLITLFLIFIVGCTFCSCTLNYVNLKKTIKITKEKLIFEEKLIGTIYFDFNFLKLKGGCNTIVYLREDKNCNYVLGMYDLEKKEIVKEALIFACGKGPLVSKVVVDEENKIYLNNDNGEILIFSSELSLLGSFKIDLKEYDIDGKRLSLHFTKGEILFAKEADKIISINKRNGKVLDILRIDKSKYTQISNNLLIQDIFEFEEDSILICYSESSHITEKNSIKALLIYNTTEKRVDRILYYYQKVEKKFSLLEEIYAVYPYFFALNKNILTVINVSQNEMINLVFEQSFYAFSMKVKNSNKEWFAYLLCPSGTTYQSKLYCFNISVINDSKI